MIRRPYRLAHLIKKHGHELFLAAALTVVGIGAIAYSVFGAG